MSAATTVLCSCCETPRPLAEVYEPVPGIGEYRCSDLAGCRRRLAYVGDPVGPPVATRAATAPGATCSVCNVTDPPGGAYQRSPGIYACLDRAGCEQRSVDFQFSHAWSDSSPDRFITSADMRATVSAAGAETPPARTELSHEQMAVRSASDDLARKTVPADGALEARMAAIARR